MIEIHDTDSAGRRLTTYLLSPGCQHHPGLVDGQKQKVLAEAEGGRVDVVVCMHASRPAASLSYVLCTST